jgi:N-acetylneuraminic acid mutarotase
MNQSRPGVGSTIRHERRGRVKAHVWLNVTALVLALTIGFLAWITAAPAAEEGTWVQKAPLPSARAEVGVARLDGKIYVVGGKADGTGLSNAVSVYDPDADSWSSAAPLPGPARDHIGLASVDGRLYALGGLTGFPQPAVARVYSYNPTTDVWEQKASLPRARGAMGVAVVSDKIYAVGGLREGAAVADLTVYDTVTNTWTAKEPMSTKRHHLVAEAVDGKVYALGGRTATGRYVGTNTAYNPATDNWTAREPMPTARSGLGSAVLNGKLYAFGGDGSGSVAGTPCLSANEEYDPATDTWRAMAPMMTSRHGTDGAVVDGAVYVPGGGTKKGVHDSAVNEAFSIDATGSSLGEWSTETSLPDPPRREGGVASAGGKVYYVGGNTGAHVLTNEVLSYNPTSRTWSSVAPYPGPAVDHVGTVNLGGIIYKIGGLTSTDAGKSAVSNVSAYNPATDSWTRKARLPRARGALGAAVVSGKIYAVGGKVDGARVASLTVYNPATDNWTAREPMPTKRDHVKAAVIGGKIYVIGGFTGGYPFGVTDKVEVYNPDTDSWSTARPMPTARADFGMSTLGRRIQAFGGVNGSGVMAVNEEYVPSTGRWRTLTPMPAARRAIDGGVTVP